MINKLLFLLGFTIQLIAFNVVAQRVAPGVPPQHYQQPQQQYQQQYQPNQQQQQQQYQQVPQQQYNQQQVPQAQIQPGQQQPQQQYNPNLNQPQAQEQHHQQHRQHGGGHHQQPVLSANIQHEKEHIAEHLEVPMDTSKMSEQELQFHYFKMHDSDNNNKLDGCELIKSLIHWHATHDKAETEEKHIYTDEELERYIDSVLKHLDANKDGWIEYFEYRQGGA